MPKNISTVDLPGVRNAVTADTSIAREVLGGQAVAASVKEAALLRARINGDFTEYATRCLVEINV